MAHEAAAVAERTARELLAQGACAVALVGSHAAGGATDDSDVDLAVVGEGPRYRLETHDGVLVSVGWATEAEQRRRLYDPVWLCTHVPGWRSAVPLVDPDGIAASIAAEARAWRWETVAAACDAFAAEAVTGLAEEALKLAAALRAGNERVAWAQRSLLALGLARPLALRRRSLYGSENRLWQELDDVHAAALMGVDAAALDLYRRAAAEVEPFLDERQRAVVARSCKPASSRYGAPRSTASSSKTSPSSLTASATSPGSARPPSASVAVSRAAR